LIFFKYVVLYIRQRKMFPKLTVKFKDSSNRETRGGDNVRVSVKQSNVNADPVKIKIKSPATTS